MLRDLVVMLILTFGLSRLLRYVAGGFAFQNQKPRRRARLSRLRLFATQALESSDNPRLNAFCRVAPSVRFKALAIFPAGVFFRAADFNSRTSADVHERRFEFLAI